MLFKSLLLGMEILLKSLNELKSMIDRDKAYVKHAISYWFRYQPETKRTYRF